ncbi:MAG: bacillithiol system redox-active protein YtxJ [Lewinellaceae bacterium]|nr:bacillithiol system redox-active protein YtxJ [Lewinellaceae bacterium]
MPVPWIDLHAASQIDEIVAQSAHTPCLLFKHSTRCNISGIAQYRLEDDWNFDNEAIVPYYLDLIRFRDLSNQIAERFQVHHESPQVLLIINGACVYEESHLGIRVGDIQEALEQSQKQTF